MQVHVVLPSSTILDLEVPVGTSLQDILNILGADELACFKCYPNNTYTITEEDHFLQLDVLDIFEPKTKDALIDAIHNRDLIRCPISMWDVSNITDMSCLFMGVQGIRDIDISNWNTSNVTNMNGMFLNSDFKGDISKWDLSSIETKEHMFNEEPERFMVAMDIILGLLGLGLVVMGCIQAYNAW